MKHNSVSLTPMTPPACTPETDAWEANGAFLVDSDGQEVAMMLGDAQAHEGHKRRLVAVLKAMRGIPTEDIENVLKGSSNHLIGEMVNKHLVHEQTIANLQESLRQHAREINQLRETLRAAHAYEIERATYARAPGAKEYMDLCKTLGIGSAGKSGKNIE